MATVKSRFDATSTISPETDGPWLTTYSRALCSISKDEDDCWDYLLSSQSSSIFSKQSENPSNTRKYNEDDLATKLSVSTTSSLASSFPETSLLTDINATSHFSNSKSDEILLPPMSPGSISHALCKIGFDCIDYFTATQDDLATEPPKPSPNSASRPNDGYTSPLLEDLTDRDWRTGLAAVVGGKRAAALERKRALSRSSSQVDVTAATGVGSSSAWFETLDRLSR
ncbi:hypothetical protein BGZ65_010934, partial [Modicella reniformis]